MKAQDIMATHFRVLIVSESFRGLSYLERSALVFEALAASFRFVYTPVHVSMSRFWRMVACSD